MSAPIPLAAADLTEPFVYERKWGVFHTELGHHQSAMGLLLAWQHNLHRAIQVVEKLGLPRDGAADYWLSNTPGAAFRSSVSKKIYVASAKGMTPLERRRFGEMCCVFGA